MTMDVHAARRSGRHVRAVAIPASALAAVGLFSSAVMPQEPQPSVKLPYGLSCSQCMVDARSTCAALPKAELVIDARQMEPIDERRECKSGGLLDAANASARAQTCQVSAASRFASVFVLRSPRPTISTKVFLSNYVIDDSSPAHVDGVHLVPDTRYILFMKKATWNAPFNAEWQVLGACQMPVKPVMAGTNE